MSFLFYGEIKSKTLQLNPEEVGAIRLKLVVDRIEEGISVLLVRPEEKKEIFWPEDLLPSGIREGHILNVEVEIDYEGTKKAEERVSDLIQRLKKGEHHKRD